MNSWNTFASSPILHILTTTLSLRVMVVKTRTYHFIFRDKMLHIFINLNFTIMPKFVNIVVSEEPRDKFFAESANASINGSSPFTHGIRCRVTGVDACQTQIDGVVTNDSPIKLVLRTNIGDISAPMLVRRKLDADGNHIVPAGTFNVAVMNWLTANPSASNEDFRNWILSTCENHELVVNRRDYAGIASDGRRYPASLVEFNIVEVPQETTPASTTA